MKNGHLQSPGLGLGAGFDEGEHCFVAGIDSPATPHTLHILVLHEHLH